MHLSTLITAFLRHQIFPSDQFVVFLHLRCGAFQAIGLQQSLHQLDQDDDVLPDGSDAGLHTARHQHGQGGGEWGLRVGGNGVRCAGGESGPAYVTHKLLSPQLGEDFTGRDVTVAVQCQCGQVMSLGPA